MAASTSSRFDTVSFLSDYGRRDEFVGVVHSVIRSNAPAVTVIDISHDVPRHDIRAGGLTLARSAQYLCPGVVLAVVDPGVGTDRRAIAISVGDGQSVLVGPDNGLLAPAVAMVGGASAAVSLTNTDFHLGAPGPTFDGRDVFAPVAAALCTGAALTDVGETIDINTLTPGILPVVRDDDGELVGEVMWIDHFGNCQLNIDPDDIEDWGDVVGIHLLDGWRTARRARTFADVGEGEVGLIVDSYGLVAIVLNRHAADAELGLRAGSEVRVRRADPGGAADGGVGVDAGVSTPVILGRRGDGGSPQ